MKDENLNQKKENAILAISQLAEKDYNDLLDAVILVANVAKKKTSAELIGIKTIINEREPDPMESTRPEEQPEPGEANNVG
jgi:anthranilate phosphoribosyltransferase